MDGGAWWAAVHGIAELDMTEQLPFHFSVSCIGEGNGNPLKYTCLENPHGQRSLVGYSQCGCKELDTTDGTPLQYSCLEDPMDGGAWKAAVHGVAEGRT